MQRTFVVPLALDARGDLVGPQGAAPGTYACPGCGARVVLRAGPIRVRHFAHGPGSCSTETALHAAAKRALAAAIERGERPVIRRACSRCEKSWDEPAPRASKAELERRIEGGLRPDVLLSVDGEPVLALEVRVRHAVDDEKAARLTLPWIELLAEQVIEAPAIWRPVAEGTVRDPCPTCAARMERDARELLRIAAEHGLDLDGFSGWRADLATCTGCGRETVHFSRAPGGSGPRGRAPPLVRYARVAVRERVGRRWVDGFVSRTVTGCLHCGEAVG